MEEIIIAGVIALAFYWIFRNKKIRNKEDNFREYYNNILYSDKYKVKAKFETK